MKKFALVAMLVAFVAAPAMASMVLVESFNGYSADQSLKGVNGWDNTRNSGSMPSAWDPENVRGTGNGTGVISDRDATTSHGGDLQLGNSGAALDIPDISDLGTIYFKMKVSDISNISVATNGRLSNFCDDGINCQSTSGWGDQASILQFPAAGAVGPTYPMRARDGTGYVNSPTETYTSEVWTEIWIQLDVGAQIAKYFTRPLGSAAAPTAVLDAGGSDEWGFRNLSYSSITTLKFNISPAIAWNCDNVPGGVDDPAVDNCLYYGNEIDSIGVNTSAMTLETVPEPATLGLLAIGSLLAIRRR